MLNFRNYSLAIGLWFLGWVPFTAFAQVNAWPTHPVKLIVPFAVGGATDIAARIIAPALGEILGQQFIVEIKSGAAPNKIAIQA